MSRFLLALLFVLPQRLQVDDFVDKVSDTYAHLDDFEADFEQISEDFSNQPRRDRGHVYLKSGKRARFDFTFPEKKFEYFDGKTFTKYMPEISQAHQMPISKADDDRMAVFQIVGNRESPWKDQFGKKEDRLDPPVMQQGNRVVRLTPNNKDLREVLIEVDPRSFFIHRLAFTYANGQRNEFRFTNIKTGRLDASVFTFTPPPKVDLIREK